MTTNQPREGGRDGDSCLLRNRTCRRKACHSEHCILPMPAAPRNCRSEGGASRNSDSAKCTSFPIEETRPRVGRASLLPRLTKQLKETVCEQGRAGESLLHIGPSSHVLIQGRQPSL